MPALVQFKSLTLLNLIILCINEQEVTPFLSGRHILSFKASKSKVCHLRHKTIMNYPNIFYIWCNLLIKEKID